MYSFQRKTTGRRKLKRGLPCEDATAVKELADCHVIACADGHGDERCRYAARGAELAAREMVKLLAAERKEAESLSEYGELLNDGRESLIERFVSLWVVAVLDDYLTRCPDDAAFRESYPELVRYAREIYTVRDGEMPVREFRALAEYRHRCDEAIYKITFLYGTTVNAAVVSGRFVFAIGIGDGDVLAVNGKRVEWLLPPYNRYTESPDSLTGRFGAIRSAFSTVYVPVTRGRSLTDCRFQPEFVMIATDGLRNAFLSDEEFAEKLLDVADAWKRGEGQRFVRLSKRWLEERTEFGVTQDDIAFVLTTKHAPKKQGRGK